jgi:hypothetical protein
MKIKSLLASLVLTLGVVTSSRAAESLSPELQAKVDARIKDIQVWAANPAIVDAVKARNTTPLPEHAAMNQDKWKALTILDPFVRSFSRNPAGEFLKSKKDETVSEAFASSADGTKVAFLAKTSSWSHQGKAKHDDPMAGKSWQGAIEVDESTGLQQVQVAVPILDGDKPIGSLVVGLSLSKLKN